jgi:hypothetical protein
MRQVRSHRDSLVHSTERPDSMTAGGTHLSKNGGRQRAA